MQQEIYIDLGELSNDTPDTGSFKSLYIGEAAFGGIREYKMKKVLEEKLEGEDDIDTIDQIKQEFNNKVGVDLDGILNQLVKDPQQAFLYMKRIMSNDGRIEHYMSENGSINYLEQGGFTELFLKVIKLINGNVALKNGLFNHMLRIRYKGTDQDVSLVQMILDFPEYICREIQFEDLVNSEESGDFNEQIELLRQITLLTGNDAAINVLQKRMTVSDIVPDSKTFLPKFFTKFVNREK